MAWEWRDGVQLEDLTNIQYKQIQTLFSEIHSIESMFVSVT